MPLAHVVTYEAIWWQHFGHQEQASAVAALSAFMGVKTRVIHVIEPGEGRGSCMV